MLALNLDRKVPVCDFSNKSNTEPSLHFGFKILFPIFFSAHAAKVPGKSPMPKSFFSEFAR